MNEGIHLDLDTWIGYDNPIIIIIIMIIMTMMMTMTIMMIMILIIRFPECIELLGA